MNWIKKILGIKDKPLTWCDMMARQVLTNHIQKIKHQQFLLTQTTN